jgi:uncharacterized protein YndB with AHSA1/START domain
MRTFLKWLAGIIAAIAIIIVGGSFFLPDQSSFSRSAEIAAPPEKVFAIVASLKRFQEYSPWAELDPKTVYAFEGPETGVGQKMRWSSEDTNVGKGAQTITELVDGKRISVDLDFGDMGTAVSVWTFEPSAAGTRATWGFTSPKLEGVTMKWMGLMFDRMVGPDYAKGLGRLKALAEKA